MANDLRTKNVNELKGFLDKKKIQERFMSLMSEEKANQFMASIINAYSTNNSLQKCTPVSVIGASLQAAALNLPINQNLGFAYMVPYGQKAQFQLG